MFKMSRNLDIIVERIIRGNKGKKINTLNENDFIDLLNFGLKNPGTVCSVNLNKRSSREYEHRIEFKEDSNTYRFIAYTYRKITNCMDDFKFPLR